MKFTYKVGRLVELRRTLNVLSPDGNSCVLPSGHTVKIDKIVGDMLVVHALSLNNGIGHFAIRANMVRPCAYAGLAV